MKNPGEKLGISIRGGSKGHPGNPLDPKDEGIFISKVYACRIFIGGRGGEGRGGGPRISNLRTALKMVSAKI